ncbi:MAG: hypothetical protein IKS21_05080 [Oscillospiraceae bacterium]|nr:hypothetical protein [Oscillospiraceae bacterium]
MPRRKAGTSLPVARRATTIRWHTSFSACGGAEGSSRCAGMSLPYGSAAEGTLQPVGQAHAPPEGGDEPAGCSQSNNDPLAHVVLRLRRSGRLVPLRGHEPSLQIGCRRDESQKLQKGTCASCGFLL